MKSLTLRPIKNSTRRASGMTLPELMVSIGVASLVLTFMAAVFVTSSRSFVEMGNYLDMDRTSRNALDQMTKKIRQSKDLTSSGPTALVFNYDGAGTTLTYRYNQTSGNLNEEWSGAIGTKTNVLLTACDSLAFSVYNNVLQSDGSFASATGSSQAKIIGVAWRCSRTVLGNKLTTEDMQQAQIVIRNKKVS